MGQVSVPVNGRSYAISCDDGQETRIRRLAQYVDAKVAEFVNVLLDRQFWLQSELLSADEVACA